MVSSILNKSRAILICILVLGTAVELGTYYYVQNYTTFPPPPVLASFLIGNLTINPTQALVNHPVNVSISIANVGKAKGTYLLSVQINDSAVETKQVPLSVNETQIVSFNVTEASQGSYNVTAGNLAGIFSVTLKPIPMPAALHFSNLFITDTEAWPGQQVNVSVDVINTGSSSISYLLPFFVNGAVTQSVQVQLADGASGTVNATLSESSLGTYLLSAGGQTNKFTIVPTGEYTLSYISTRLGFRFTLDGVSEVTPFSELVTAGPHTITVPSVEQIEIQPYGLVSFNFAGWQDGSTSLTRTFNVQGATYAVTDYIIVYKPGSCPYLYVWNGKSYSYYADVNDGTGWLGYLEYFKPDGSMVFSYNYPYDYIKLDPTQLKPDNGFYDFKIAEMSDEIFYLDSVQMIAVDHPANVNVFSTASTFIYNLTGQGTIYTVNDKPAIPVSAVNSTGQNVLPLISKMDGSFTSGTIWKWQSLTLNLGDLTGAKDINLVVGAKITWPTTQAGGENFLKYASEPGVIPSPPPYMQVMASNGSWVNVPNDREFPIPHTTDSEFDVNLTGLFPTNNYELKINYYQDIQFDYVGISTAPQQNVIVHTITPSSATLDQAFGVTSNSTGAFTRYGNVTSLLQSNDNQFVIGREGDVVNLQFSANLPPVLKGWVRDYFIIASCWFKGNGLPYVPFTVNPLPFYSMTSFPYPPDETYPYTAANLAYLQTYNTRIINSP